MTDQALVDELVGNAHGNLARVKEILEAHPELINVAAVWKETPVEAATQMGNRAIIDYLVARGAPVDFFTALTLSQTDRVRSDLEAKPELAHSRGVRLRGRPVTRGRSRTGRDSDRSGHPHRDRAATRSAPNNLM